MVLQDPMRVEIERDNEYDDSVKVEQRLIRVMVLLTHFFNYHIFSIINQSFYIQTDYRATDARRVELYLQIRGSNQ